MAKNLNYNTSLINKIPKSSIPELQEIRSEMETYTGEIFYPMYISKLSSVPERITKRYPGYKDVFQQAFESNNVCYHDPFESPLSVISKQHDKIEKSYCSIITTYDNIRKNFKAIKDLLNPIIISDSSNIEKELSKIPHDIRKTEIEYYTTSNTFDVKNHLIYKTIQDMCIYKEIDLLKEMELLLINLKKVISKLVELRKNKYMSDPYFRRTLEHAKSIQYLDNGKLLFKLKCKMNIAVNEKIPFQKYWIDDMLDHIQKHGFNNWSKV